MNRRDFLTAASGVAGGAAAASTAAAQEEQPTTTSGGTGTEAGGEGTGTTGTDSGGGGGGGSTETVAVGPEGEYVYTPGTDEPLYITPGTTVEWVWESDNHNIAVDSQPDGANWEGHEPIENEGFTYTHTFETTGTYEYFCTPHQNLGMVASLVVNEQGAPAEGGGGEVDPEEMGVPFHPHYVGLATVLMMLVSIVFAFYILKYGESPHSSAPNKK